MTSVTTEEQVLLALVFLFRPAEKNRLVKKVLLEKEGQKQTSAQKSTIEKESFSGPFKAKDHDVFDVRWQG